ncbi:unnamed protein product [Rotaria magnacalcarata]|uniref:Tetratricopeptide repeat protein n=1 Tax=Rotaria magnacalcarata TaxID=392030 RepID=A0A820ECI2_9BILA|nr:unnamed protein product [Rotaria magnacalcarata]CAF2111072.1 unnamed protein product [Rotaria magnacalcarata]CAF4229162.1 unnamed protein product [Rotaria magnacalcarata]CAF4244735.1 unnamed protein product [Rotaria magnacalcarata]
MEQVRTSHQTTQRTTNQQQRTDEQISNRGSKLFADACNWAQRKDFDKAKDSFAKIPEESSEYPVAQYLLGCTSMELRNLENCQKSLDAFDKARVAFEKQKKPLPEDFYYKKGFAHWMVGQCDDAVKNFSEFIAYSQPMKAQVGYLNRGLVHCDLHEYEKALEDLNIANKNEENQTAYSLCSRGRVLAHLCRYEDAKIDFLAALHKSRGDFHGHLQAGIAYSELGEYENALEQLDISLKLKPIHNRDLAEVYFRQALLYRLRGETDKAIEQLLHAIDAFPEYAGAYLCLGRLYLVKNDHVKALENLNKAHQCDPCNAVIMYELGSFHEQAERLDSALFNRKRGLGVVRQVAPKPTPTQSPPTPEISPITEIAPSQIPNTNRRSSHTRTKLLRDAMELEQTLPYTNNRILTYQKTIECYQKAIDSGECPEAYVYMSLCQEAENDFVKSFYSMDSFYKELEQNKDAHAEFLESLEELRQDLKQDIHNAFLTHRCKALEDRDKNMQEITQYLELLGKHHSPNMKLFYQSLRRLILQALTAFYVAGCPLHIISHNLRGPLGT